MLTLFVEAMSETVGTALLDGGGGGGGGGGATPPDVRT